jgi:hypothetical protein
MRQLYANEMESQRFLSGGRKLPGLPPRLPRRGRLHPIKPKTGLTGTPASGPT